MQDYHKLTKFFADLLHKSNDSKSLVIFLDSLDNLAEDDGALQLTWLPLTLPPHVKLVVSTLPDEKYQCYPILKVNFKTNVSWFCLRKTTLLYPHEFISYTFILFRSLFQMKNRLFKYHSYQQQNRQKFSNLG